MKIREAYSAEKGLAYFDDIRDVDEAFRYVLWGAQKIEKYTIKPGDTFYLISQKYHLAFSDLLAANPDLDPQHLKAGDVVSLTVPKPLFNVEVSYRHVYEQIIFPPVVVNPNYVPVLYSPCFGIRGAYPYPMPIDEAS